MSDPVRPTEPSRVRRRLLTWIPALAISAGLLALAVRGVDADEARGVLTSGSFGHLLIGLVVLSGAHTLRAVRWRILLSSAGRLSVPTVFWAMTIGYLVNAFLPARAGEVVRSIAIARAADRPFSHVFATAVTERVLDVVALVSIATVALLTVETVPDWMVGAIRLMAVVGLAGLIGLILVSRGGGVLHGWLNRLPLPVGLKTRLGTMIESFAIGLQAFQNPGRAAAFALLSIVIWLTDGVVAVIVAQGFGLPFHLGQALLLLAALGLSSAIPSTPGYVGVYQFVAISVLVPFGISRSAALVYILAFQAVSYTVVITWGLIGLWRLGPFATLRLVRNAPGARGID